MVTDGGPKVALEILAVVQVLLKDFGELLPNELLVGLPLMHDIQHHIDLVASLPNLLHNWMNP